MIVRLGESYRDVATGTVGVATARTEHLGGAARVCLEWRNSTGAGVESWFDEGRLDPEAENRTGLYT